MKPELSLLLCALFCMAHVFTSSAAPIDELEPELRGKLEWLRAYADGASVKFEERKNFEQTLSQTVWNISRVLYEATSSDWANPSPERRAIIDRVQSTIAPYNQALLNLGFRQDRESSTLANQSVTLLKYTKPDEALANALRERLTAPPKVSGPATSILFEHRLLNEGDKQTILEQFTSEQNKEKRVGRALGLSKMGMPEGVPVLAEMLDAPFTAEGTVGNTGVFGENEALSNYRKVVEAINYLGPSASSLLPLLRARLREVEAALPPDQAPIYSAQLRSAIAQAEGKAPLRIPTAINGTGLLVSGAQAKNELTPAPTAATPTPVTPVPTATPAASPAPTTPVAQTPAVTVERKSPVWPWVVGILALIVIVTVAMKRRA